MFKFLMNLLFLPLLVSAAPILELSGPGISGVKDAEYHPTYKVLFIADSNGPFTTAEVDNSRLAGDAFTISAWFVPRSPAGGYRQIVFKGVREGGRNRVDFKFGLYDMVPEFGYTDKNGSWRGVLRGGDKMYLPGKSGIPLAQCPKAVSGHWNFLAASFDRGIIRICLNGEMVFETSARLPYLRWSDTPLLIGYGQSADNPGAFRFDGLLDRIALYDRAFSSEELQELYRKQRKEYPETEISLVSRIAEQRKEYDPQFRNKLSIVEKYEKNLPTSKAGKNAEFTVVLNAGVPMIARNGIPESGMCMIPQPYADNQGVFNASRDFAAAGINYYSEILWPWITYRDSCSNWWLGPGKYDFKTIEARFSKIVEANPEARLIVRIKLNMPEWWLKAYPEERVAFFDGKKAPQPSMSSERWLSEVSVMLGDLVRHLEHSKLAPYIAGYVPAGGETSEWFWWGYYNGLVDYSQVNLKAFRNFLHEEYGTDAALQKAWNKDGITLNSVQIPLPKLRNQSEDGFFRDPVTARSVRDYRVFMSRATTKAIRHFAGIIRQNLTRPKLIGAFYGYSVYLAGTEHRIDNLGFQDLAGLLADSELDFFCSPTVYDRRRAGEEGDYSLAYTASLKLHGKVYYDEADMRTHLHDGKERYRTESEAETLSVNWRSFGNALTHGVNIWWFLLADNASFHSESIMNQMAQIAALDKELIGVSRRSKAEIAVFCDEGESLNYVNATHEKLRAYIRGTQATMGRVGAPCDFYLLDDIAHPNLPDYKLYIFPNAWYVTAEQRKSIHKKLARNKATALWLYAPGYLSPEGASVENMKALTGISFQRIAPGPVFSADTDLRKMPWGYSIWSQQPLNTELIRKICNDVGIHLYLETDDVVSVNEGFLMIHATSDGIKKIQLPSKRRVRNLADNTFYPATASIILDLKRGETVIFQLL